MGDGTGIEWTEATWNPVVGCSKVSPGCAHCYAEQVHKTRLDGKGAYPAFKPWTPENASHNVTLVPERLDQPLRWTKPRMVFVNSMSDLFHEQVPDEYIGRVLNTIYFAQRHTFQILTKRPERMVDCIKRYYQHGGLDGTGNPSVGASSGYHAAVDHGRRVLHNLWLGVSIENRRYVHRADLLRETPAAVRFISAEPLLGPLVLTDLDLDCDPAEGQWGWCRGCGGAAIYAFGDDHYCSTCEPPPGLDLTDIHWLIVGGESGPAHRHMNPEWVRGLRDVAVLNRTAFFFKQWGGPRPKSNGRELDGRTWDEMPEVCR